MTNSKYTPTPWVHKDGEVYEENDFKIFDAYNSDFLYEEDKANAAHIVKCVNMHDELVEALKKIANNEFKDADELWRSEALVTFIDRLNDIAADAIKKAGAL